MGRLTTHVLDTARGKPASGISGQLYAVGTEKALIAEFVTNSDGRVDEPLLGDSNFRCGTYELVFRIADYFAADSPDSPPAGEHFLDDVVIRFHIGKNEHYHVPLLVSPWSYTTYRGS